MTLLPNTPRKAGELRKPGASINAGEIRCYVESIRWGIHDGASSGCRRWSCSRNGSRAKLGVELVISGNGVNGTTGGRQKLE